MSANSHSGIYKHHPMPAKILEEDRTIFYEIKDNGSGIDKENRKKNLISFLQPRALKDRLNPKEKRKLKRHQVEKVSFVPAILKMNFSGIAFSIAIIALRPVQ